MAMEGWNKQWENNNLGWHRQEINEFLVKHQEQLFNGRSSMKIFLPLCGKALEIKWFYDLGHIAVGVEGVETGITDFFKEQNLEYTVEPADKCKGKLYKSIDGRIRLYYCNLFDFSSEIEGKFDGIWDRGSLVAIDAVDRIRYRDLLVSLMNPECHYFIEALDYNNEEKDKTAPHNITAKHMSDLYGEKCSITQLDYEEIGGPGTMYTDKWKCVHFGKALYLLKLKQ